MAIHRKHHALVETEENPHSPQIYGIKKVLFQGWELYREEQFNKQTWDDYGHGTPDDWLERHVYEKHSMLGVTAMAFIDIILFGPIGITIWAVLML